MRQAVTVVWVTVILVMSVVGVGQAAQQVERSSLATARATVEAVDQQTRMVTLRGEDGTTFAIKAGPDVRNLSQVKPGDLVNVKYYQSLLVQVAQPGQQPMSAVTRGTERAAPGQKPGGVAVEQMTTTATVVDVDKKNSMVTLKGPEGNEVKVKAQDPKNIENLKEGDQLNITYTQAMAVSVEKARG